MHRAAVPAAPPAQREGAQPSKACGCCSLVFPRGRWVRRRRLPLSPRRGNSSGGTASDRHLRRKTAPSERGSECGRSCAGKRDLDGLFARPWGRGTLEWGLTTAPTPVAVTCGTPLDPSPSASQMDPCISPFTATSAHGCPTEHLASLTLESRRRRRAETSRQTNERQGERT